MGAKAESPNVALTAFAWVDWEEGLGWAGGGRQRVSNVPDECA